MQTLPMLVRPLLRFSQPTAEGYGDPVKIYAPTGEACAGSVEAGAPGDADACARRRARLKRQLGVPGHGHLQLETLEFRGGRCFHPATGEFRDTRCR